MTFLQQLHWREPLWLLLGLQPALLWLIHRIWQGRQLTAYADRNLWPWIVLGNQANWRTGLVSRTSAYTLAWLLFALAAAGPRLPLNTPHLNADINMNIMVVMDVSRSMTVNDILPNRLRRAELELYELLSRAHGQRVGMIVFAARAHVFVPMTWDFAALRYYLQSLDKLVLPTRGSGFIEALKLAKDTLIAAPQYGSIPSAIVLISDGDTGGTREGAASLSASFQQMTQELKASDLPVYALGVGSTEGGSIPLEDGGWLSYENKPVISRMDESTLRQLAQTTGGSYSRAREDDSDWYRLYDQGMLSKLAGDEDNERLWLELYPWVLCPAIVLFFLAVIPVRLRSPVMLTSACILIAMAVTQDISHAADLSKKEQAYQAYQAYQQQKYASAVEQYAEVPGYDGRLGEGAAYYRLENYQGAKRQFSDAVLQADNEQQRANALFNLGNSYFQQGDYQSAAKAYADVLRYRQSHAAAKHNLALSSTLQQQITLELEEQDNATAAGRGPRSARPVTELNLAENSSLALEESEEDSSTIIPQLPEEEQQAWQELIRRGLEFVQVAASGESRGELQQRRQDLEKARLFMLQLQEQPATLWQRLFELEEGFEAPQRKPNDMPGVAPW